MQIPSEIVEILTHPTHDTAEARGPTDAPHPRSSHDTPLRPAGDCGGTRTTAAAQAAVPAAREREQGRSVGQRRTPRGVQRAEKVDCLSI